MNWGTHVLPVFYFISALLWTWNLETKNTNEAKHKGVVFKIITLNELKQCQQNP